MNISEESGSRLEEHGYIPVESSDMPDEHGFVPEDWIRHGNILEENFKKTECLENWKIVRCTTGAKC